MTDEGTYTQYCPKLKKSVELGWYDTHCECGDEIIGVTKRPTNRGHEDV